MFVLCVCVCVCVSVCEGCKNKTIFSQNIDLIESIFISGYCCWLCLDVGLYYYYGCCRFSLFGNNHWESVEPFFCDKHKSMWQRQFWFDSLFVVVCLSLCLCLYWFSRIFSLFSNEYYYFIFVNNQKKMNEMKNIRNKTTEQQEKQYRNLKWLNYRIVLFTRITSLSSLTLY